MSTPGPSSPPAGGPAPASPTPTPPQDDAGRGRFAGLDDFRRTRLWARLRTALTLVVLVGVLLAAVQWAFGRVTEPLPELATGRQACETTTLEPGSVLRPPRVVVSVLNAGDRAGAAETALDGLQDQGFARGLLNNAQALLGDDEDPVRVRSAQIWTEDPDSPAVTLLRSYLGGDVRVVERASPVEGLTLVVGDQFPGVRKGRPQVPVRAESQVCGPLPTSPGAEPLS